MTKSGYGWDKKIGLLFKFCYRSVVSWYEPSCGAYSNGTTHMIFEPLDFISKLAALVPMPGANLTRFHGVFAPNSQYRAQIIKHPDESKASEQEVRTESEKRAAMTWAQRLKRAFSIDIEICEVCGGKAKAIACIVDPGVINKILKHLNHPSFPSNQVILPAKRAPPVFNG